MIPSCFFFSTTLPISIQYWLSPVEPSNLKFDGHHWSTCRQGWLFLSRHAYCAREITSGCPASTKYRSFTVMLNHIRKLSNILSSCLCHGFRTNMGVQIDANLRAREYWACFRLTRKVRNRVSQIITTLPPWIISLHNVSGHMFNPNIPNCEISLVSCILSH